MLGNLGGLGENLELALGNVPPPCFGAFDKADAGCLRCNFQDDCIVKKEGYEMANVKDGIQELAREIEAVGDDEKIEALNALDIDQLRGLCDFYEIGYVEIAEDPNGDKSSLVLSIDDYYEEAMLTEFNKESVPVETPVADETTEGETATDGTDEVEEATTPEPVEKDDVGADTGWETRPAVEKPEPEVDETEGLPEGFGV